MPSLPHKLTSVGLFLAVLLAAILILANLAKGSSYPIFVDGDQIVIEGRYESVAEIVNAADIHLGPEDLIFPPLDHVVDPGTGITIKHALPVKLHIGSGSHQEDDDEGNDKIFYTHQAYLGQFLLEAGQWLTAADQVVADGKLITWEELTTTPLPRSVEVIRQKSVTVHEDGVDIELNTFARSVGEALLDGNIRLFAADLVTPSLRTPITATSEITIARSKPLVLKVDSRVVNTRSQAQTVPELLEDMAVTLNGLDYTIPGNDSLLNTGDAVEVIRVSEVITYTDEIIAYDSLSQLTADLELDQRAIIQPGVPGTLRRSTVIRYENGIEVGREPSGETVIQAPVDEVVGIGSKVVIRTVDTPAGPMEYWRVVRMRVTAYTAATSGKDPSHPAYGITASGVPAGFGVVAVDPSIVPFRSYVYVPGYGRAFAGDTGGGVKGRFIDLGYNEGEIVAWNGYVDVYYLTPAPPADAINYILPSYLP